MMIRKEKQKSRESPQGLGCANTNLSVRQYLAGDSLQNIYIRPFLMFWVNCGHESEICGDVLNFRKS